LKVVRVFVEGFFYVAKRKRKTRRTILLMVGLMKDCIACFAILINDIMHCYITRNSSYILEAT
jgi:hypothetical protein